jgi:hypothetical protein
VRQNPTPLLETPENESGKFSTTLSIQGASVQENRILPVSLCCFNATKQIITHVIKKLRDIHRFRQSRLPEVVTLKTNCVRQSEARMPVHACPVDLG